MKKLSVKEVDVRGRRVFVRVDFNVPLSMDGGELSVTDDRRIVESLPTLNLILERGGVLVWAARPQGDRSESGAGGTAHGNPRQGPVHEADRI